MPLEGANRLIRKLQAIREKVQKDTAVSVVVGYTMSYALPVHENLDAHHKIGQAKYLEEPARTKREVIAQIVRHVTNVDGSLRKALKTAGLYLQGESQALVPVDTGALKASAFTREE